MIKKYFIFYELGVHHLAIETTKDYFFNVIDDLSCEFKIFINENDCNPDVVSYKILNYCGDLQSIGFILSVPLV